MRYLIRFEDTYGIADIVAALTDRPFINIDEVQDMHNYEDVAIQQGLGIARCLNPSWYDMEEIVASDFETVVTVFDLDSEDGDKRKILSEDRLKNKITKMTSGLIDRGFKGKLVFIPVVYCAETIVLYQHIKDAAVQVESYVSNWNTQMFHLMLLSALNKCGAYKNAKKVRNFFNRDLWSKKVKESILGRTNINNLVLTWLLNLDTDVTISVGDTLTAVRCANTLFYKNLDIPCEFILREVKLHTNMSKKELEEMFKQLK